MTMYVYGVHPVEELLARASNRVEEVVVAGDLTDHQFATIAERVDRTNTPTRTVGYEELDRLAEGGNHQRIAAKVSDYPYLTLDEARAVADRSDGHGLIVALAGVQDPHNLGAILRSAGALGADAVVIPKHRAAQMTPAVARASAGVAFQVPIARVTNLAKALRKLKDGGWWTVGTVADDAQPLWQIDWQMDAVVVMGGEHKGMRPGVEKVCDFRVEIPMAKGVESLNVSVACGIALYDRLRSLKE